MYHIHQEELFSFEELLKSSPDVKYSAVLEHLPMGMMLHAISKGKVRGRPETLNTRAMIYSLIIGKMEHMRFTKDVVKRLRTSIEFRTLCRFTGSDRIPSEAAYSRLVTKLERCGILRHVQDVLVDQAISEGFLTGEVLALDSSQVEAFDRNPKLDESRKNVAPKASSPASAEEAALLPKEAGELAKEAKPEKPKRTKRGRIPKAEEAAWQEQVKAYEASLTFFEKEVADMLPATYEELVACMPRYPSTGAKGDPRGTHRVKYWFGYKVNLLVDTSSQYIVTGVTCSAHVSDQRPALVLLKRLEERFPRLRVQYVLADKGYDGEPIYRQIRKLGAFGIIPLVHRSRLPAGRDGHCRPLCQAGHAYRYDSYDPKRDRIKLTRPKACPNCPFKDSGCQKVYQIRVEDDIRKYTAPGRGSEAFKQLFKQRTAIERVFSYLKLYFEMGSTRKLKTRAGVDVDLSCLTYNLCKLALDYTNKKMDEAKQAA